MNEKIKFKTKKYNLEINDFGRINHADIEINKINVVGGVNASGKSTASKLLYCFLKANSYYQDCYILPKIIPELNMLIKYVDDPKGNDDDIPDRLSINAKKFEVIEEYEKYKDKFQEIKKSVDESQIEYLRVNLVETIIEALINKDNVLSSCILSYLLSDESLVDFSHEEPNSGTHFLKGNIKFYSDSFESIIHNDCEVEFDEEGNPFFIVETDIDFDDDFYYSTKGHIKKFTRVFYIGTLSLFDLDKYINSPVINKKPIFGYEYHMDELIKYLKNINHKVHVPDNVKEIQNKIEKIIEGNFKGNGRFYNFSFSQEDNNQIQPVNTSSGIKQIGMLQLLLKNNHLIPGSFLIIDEPEVNLHPTWQFKFAEILVLLAKELNVTIYLNSHSPMFIEAIDVFCEFYDMENDINYYLTQKVDGKDKYNFTKIKSNQLYKLYENLGNGYKLINKVKLRKRLNR